MSGDRLILEQLQSREYAFACGVVKFIMDFFSERWEHTYGVNSSAVFTPEIRSAVEFLARDKFPSFEDFFDMLLQAFPKTPEGFQESMLTLTVLFYQAEYTNSKFLFYCTEVSVYALFMFKDGLPTCPDIAVSIIFKYLWDVKSSGESIDIASHNAWNQLHDFCCELLIENQENPHWRNNVLCDVDSFFY